jgi:hypothetical protein
VERDRLSSSAWRTWPLRRAAFHVWRRTSSSASVAQRTTWKGSGAPNGPWAVAGHDAVDPSGLVGGHVGDRFAPLLPEELEEGDQREDRSDDPRDGSGDPEESAITGGSSLRER